MIIRGQFSHFYLETMLPAINSVIWNRYKRFPPQWSRIFRSETTTRSIEQTSQVTNLGLFTQLTENQAIRYDQPMQGFPKNFIPTRFGLGFEVSQDVVEDDKIGLVAKTAGALGRSAKETMEIDFASVFNNGFSGSYLGPDGVALFATNHPLIKAGGVQANTLAAPADLDVTSLELALTDYETMRDSAGHKISLPAPRLVVAPANRWNAAEILEGKMRSDTANNTVNAFRYANNGPVSDWFVWQYLTDPDTWFLCAEPDDTELIVFFRRRPYTRSWFDDATESGKTAMRYKKAHGWADFYGTFGVQGA